MFYVLVKDPDGNTRYIPKSQYNQMRRESAQPATSLAQPRPKTSAYDPPTRMPPQMPTRQIVRNTYYVPGNIPNKASSASPNSASSPALSPSPSVNSAYYVPGFVPRNPMELGSYYDKGKLVRSPYKSKAAADAAARRKAAAKALTPKRVKLTPDKRSFKPQVVPRASGGVGIGTTTRPRVVPSPSAPPPFRQASGEMAPRGASWLDKIVTLGSQIISGSSRNPTIQTVGGQVPIYQPQYEPPASPNYQPQYEPSQYQNPNQNPNSPGGAVGSGIDGIVQWATANPLFVFGGIGAVYLLFKEPPRGKR